VSSNGGQQAYIPTEYRVGRLKHERVRVSRDERTLLDTAHRLFDFHASRKTVLELELEGEEGTGLGPTLEFYALVAAELQRKQLAMWLVDDDDEDESRLEQDTVDLGEGVSF
jgi:E3 ubiquitin-protein ligase HECTD1